MANYFQFRSKHPEYKLLYYVCGEELALRLEVADAVVVQWSQMEVDKWLVSAKDGFAAIESAVLTDSQRLRIVMIENVDKLTDEQKDRVRLWAWKIVQGLIPQIVLIVVTEEVNPDTAAPLYRPFVEKGRFVECKQLSVDNMKKYAMEDYRLTDAAADLLLELVSFNFMKLNNELEKIANLDLHVVDAKVISDLVVFSADDLFVSHLLRRSPLAAKVVSAVPKSAIPGVMNVLARKLAFLYGMIKADAPGTNAHKLAAMLGVQPWQLLEYFPIKRYWTMPLVLEKLRLLTVMEAQFSSQASNILVLLAAWW